MAGQLARKIVQIDSDDSDKDTENEMVNISELPTLNANAVPWIPVGEGQATQSPIQMNIDVSSSPDSSECAKMDDQEFHIDWSRYSAS